MPNVVRIESVPLFRPGRWHRSGPDYDSLACCMLTISNDKLSVPVRIGHTRGPAIGTADGFCWDGELLTGDLAVYRNIYAAIQSGELHALSVGIQFNSDFCTYLLDHIALLTRVERPAVHSLPSLQETIRCMKGPSS